MPTKGLLQTKGTTDDPDSHARGLVCWKGQPFIHISNLTKLCCSFAPSFPQLELRYPSGIPKPKD